MKKEPFLQVSKRRNKARWQERLLIRFIALILALIVCGAVIVALVKMNPVDVYKAIWDGAMGSNAVCGRPYEIQWYCCVFPLVWHLHLK